MLDTLNVDPQSPEFFADPYPTFKRLRREAPVYWLEKYQVWMVTKYDDIVDMSRRAAGRFTHERTPETAKLVLRPEQNADLDFKELRYNLGVAGDPPGHTRRKRSVMRWFTPGTTEREQAPYIRELAEQLVDRIDSEVPVGGTFDFNKMFSGPLPTLVITRILGVPQENHELLHRLTEVSVGSNTDMSVPVEDLVKADRELREALNAVYDLKRREPADDLVSHLVGRVDAGEVSEEEARQILWHLFIGGNETTSNWFNNGLAALLDHPEEYEKVLDDRTLIPNFTEETLRWQTPVVGSMKKFAIVDQEVRGVTIKKGQRIWQVGASGNRDEEHFDDPDRFDVTRANAAEHLSFGGGGPHLCLGWPLARIEAQVGWQVLLEKLPRLGYAAEPPVKTNGPGIRGYTRFPVTRLS